MIWVGMQNKVNILIDLINKSCLKPTQKALGFKVITEIVGSYNLLESKYFERIKRDNKINKKINISLGSSSIFL